MSIKIGIDIGGTKISGALFKGKKLINNHLIVYDKYTIFTKYVLETYIYKIINLLLEDEPGSLREVDFIGIACTGVIDNEKKLIEFSSNLNLCNIDMNSVMNVAPNFLIFNDAFTNAFGEFLLNKQEFYNKRTLVLVMGTGIGGSIIENLESKIHICTNMELGHIVIEKDGLRCTCGRNGCLNMYISSGGINRLILNDLSKDKEYCMPCSSKSNYALIEKLFNHEIVDYDYSSHLTSELVRLLEIGIVNCTNAYFPDVIILSGGLSKYYHPFLDEIEKNVNLYSLKKNVKIKISRVNHIATLYGAANLDIVNKYIT